MNTYTYMCTYVYRCIQESVCPCVGVDIGSVPDRLVPRTMYFIRLFVTLLSRDPGIVTDLTFLSTLGRRPVGNW